MVFVIGGLLIIIFLIRKYFQNVYSFWDKLNIPIKSPYKYIVGHALDVITFKKSIADVYTKIYRESEGCNYVGFYRFQEPVLLLRSPELIKDVMVKDFGSFYNNDFHIDEKVDMIFSKNPFILWAPKWKEVRNHITPCFSTSKVKAMLPLIQENCDKMLKYLSANEEAFNGTGLESKELCSKFTSENIASCAFGMNGGAFTNPKAEFREMGRALTQPTFWNGIKTLAIFVLPSISSIFKVKLYTDEITAYLRNLVSETLQYRQTNRLARNDFLDQMVAVRNKINNEDVFNQDDIVAHIGGLILDGFETTSGALSYLLYELAVNSDAQEKLREEIDEAMDKYNGEITYEAVQEMNYLDCAIKESLRIHPPLLHLLKLCTRDYKLPACDASDDFQPEIKAGTSVVIPVQGLHMDPTYFPEPEHFDPDRFSEENKDNITKFAYLPFGEGPRICLGMKFGLLQVKMAVISIFYNYKIKNNKKTQEPLRVDPNAFLNAPIGGMWLNFSKRNK